MMDISKLKQTILTLIPEHEVKLFNTIAIILFLWLFRTLLIRIVFRNVEDSHNRYTWKEGINYTAVVFGLILLVPMWIEGIKSVVTVLVLIATALTLVLKEPILNFVSWILILWRGLFSVGNRIQVGSHIGDVIQTGFFYFTLLEVGNWVDAEQSTGRILKIPNSLVLTLPVANYSRGFPYIWNEIPVLITSDSNWKKAKYILKEIVDAHAGHLSKDAEEFIKKADEEIMHFRRLTPVVYTSVKKNGILLTLRYLCIPRNRRDSEQAIWEAILEALSECNDIKLLYGDD
jgi:small-conductance mechanosensitive channel